MVKTVLGSLAALLLFLASGTVEASTQNNTGSITVTVSASTAPGQAVAVPTTYPAYDVSREYGPTSEFAYSGVVESYAKTQTVRNMKFMNVHRVRDAPNGDYAPYVALCQGGIGFSQGFNMLQANGPSSTSAPTNPTLTTATYVEQQLDAIKTATGCYPARLDPGNESDNFGSSFSNGYGYDDLVDAAAPGTTCTSFTTTSSSNPCDVPRWAYYAAHLMHAMHDAVISNSKYAGVLVYGASLAHANPAPAVNNFLILSQAWYDMYGNTPFTVDVAVQHQLLSVSGTCPADSSTGCGLTTGIVNTPYAKETVTGHSPSGGFSGYAAPGTVGWVPQNFEPLRGRESSYYASGNDIDNPLATHFIPRDLLKAFNSGIQDLDYDFFNDKPSTVNTTHFAQVGWVDLLANPKASSYAEANMEHMLGAGNTGARTTATQLAYQYAPSSGIISYSYQDDNGNYWLVLVNNANETTAYPNGAQTPANGCTGPVAPAGSCYNVAFQGAHYNFVPFTNVTVSGLPSNLDHAAVYQNDEYCNNTMTQDSTPWGDPLINYPAGANTDCMQWWPAGSLQRSIQTSYPTISNGTISGLKVNGMPLFIHLSANQLPVIPTMTPLPYNNPSTPAPGNPIPTVGPTQLPTPVPTFGPPTAVVPTPPV